MYAWAQSPALAAAGLTEDDVTSGCAGRRSSSRASRQTCRPLPPDIATNEGAVMSSMMPDIKIPDSLAAFLDRPVEHFVDGRAV